MGEENGRGAAVNEGTMTIRQPCPPFCWQNKIVLDFIRRHTAESILPNSLLVYFVLTELASDEHAEGDFRAKHSAVMKKCGLSRSSIVRRIKHLEQIGAIRVFPNFGTDGRQLPSSILLRTPDELPRGSATVARGEGVTMTRGEGVMTPPPADTPSLISKKEEEESPHTPQGGAASPSACPGIEEVRAYAAEIGADAGTAERFHATNTAGGWTMHGRAIRNWKKAFIAFDKRDRAAAPSGRNGTHPATAPRARRKTFLRADHAKEF